MSLVAGDILRVRDWKKTTKHKTTFWLMKRQEETEGGVTYSPRHGALYPACSERAKIYSTKSWEGSVRIRYHRYCNLLCLFNRIGKTIKSVEEDITVNE
ncbi:hypothetical protein [Desulfogranum japonicum]|uniref:hypothetical protein n=1 Tax=Desulfogranum japonicum TaxID=231447 RepID=UPI00041C5265|nr:hypothetical protein [Desulfogranum japonicum]